ncbi:MAG: hypothetical protein IJZ17_03555 [Muribaculaceae bacterium]|nr:hypothetical protein [Muribaculaceae bacterium]
MDYPPIDYVLESGTPIQIRTTESVSSDHAFGYIMGEVVHDVYASDGNTVLISKGEDVTISAVFKKAGALGKPGMITITGATTRAVDGKVVLLNVAHYTQTGENREGLAWVLGMLGFLCCVFGIFFLLIKGKQAEMPYGTYFDYSIIGNYKILSGAGAQCKM